MFSGLLGGELAGHGYRVLAPDHPGYGHSETAEWRAEQEPRLRYVESFLDAVGVSGRYFLGGISLRGGLAIGHSLSHGGGLRGLVLIGSYGCMDRRSRGLRGRIVQWASWAAQRSGMLDAALWLMSRSRTVLRRSLWSLLVNEDARTSQVVDEVGREARTGSGRSGAFGEWQRSEVGPIRLRTNYVERLGEIDGPVLLVHGRADKLVPLFVARRAAILLPDGRLVEVPGAGHWAQRDQSAVVAHEVLAFLEGCETPAEG